MAKPKFSKFPLPHMTGFNGFHLTIVPAASPGALHPPKGAGECWDLVRQEENHLLGSFPPHSPFAALLARL